MKQKILIVDDQVITLKLIEDILKKIPNLEIIKVNNAEEALASAQTHSFALAIIDVVMPDVGGYELSKKLHANENHATLPVIFISVLYSDEAEIIKGYEAGAADFLTKPINAVILLSKVKIFLKLDSYKNHLENLVDQKTIELELAIQKWQLTFDSIQDYLSIIDLDQKILMANKAMIDKFGDDILDKTCHELFHPSACRPADCPALLMMNDGHSHYQIIEEGQNYFDVSVAPIINENGDIESYIHVVRDITERKNIEISLQHSDKMRAIGQLAGGIAHDFNNQLTAILGYATLLRNKLEDDDKLLKYANTIMVATKRSASLTKKLLSFARKGIAKKEGHDIHKLLNESLDLAKSTINKKNTIKIELNAVNSIANCDASQITTAFLNLILNANDAIQHKGTITISTTNMTAPCSNKPDVNSELFNEYICIKFTDTGVGIPDQVKSRIFEPFFSTKEEKGNGLGLASVYGTIKSHDGNIDFSTEVGKGTEFTIQLHVINEHDNIGEETLFSIDDAKELHSKNMNILIADDEESLRAYTEHISQTFGYSVELCCNGKEAVDAYRKNGQNIDLVILDVVMPVMDGLQAYKEIKVINPNAKIIFMSGYSDHNIDELSKKNSDLLLKKPFTLRAFSKAVAQALT